MNKLMTKIRKNKKGFTLAELLVVVAIIGVLVAVSIPVFGSALEKANHAVDLADVRAEYAQLVLNGMTGKDYGSGGSYKVTIDLSDLQDAVKHGSTVDVKTGTPEYITVTLNGHVGQFPIDSDVTINETPSGS